MEREMPVFVKIEEYKEVLDVVELIKNKIVQARTTLGKINELKNEEDTQLELWKGSIEEVENRIDAIDDALLEPQSM
jgi:uncharacterized protein Yka (UPF0111/DUF47 family)